MSINKGTGMDRQEELKYIIEGLTRDILATKPEEANTYMFAGRVKALAERHEESAQLAFAAARGEQPAGRSLRDRLNLDPPAPSFKVGDLVATKSGVIKGPIVDLSSSNGRCAIGLEGGSRYWTDIADVVPVASAPGLPINEQPHQPTTAPPSSYKPDDVVYFHPKKSSKILYGTICRVERVHTDGSILITEVTNGPPTGNNQLCSPDELVPFQ